MTDSPHPAALPFTPVPGRARHDGWTPARQRAFIEVLAATGTVTAAARAVGMSAKSAYRLRARAGDDSGFARAWNAALERSYQDALTVALDRGIEGVKVPVFYGGRQIGEYRRYDDRLTLAALRVAAARKLRPEAADEAEDTAADLHRALEELASSTFAPNPREL